MRTGVIQALVMVALVGAGSASAATDFADTPEATVGSGVGSGIPPGVAARAGISAEQEQEIARLTGVANEDLDKLRARHREAQQKLQELLKTTQPSEASVLAQLERVGATETEVRKNRVQLMLKIRKLLGPRLWNNLQMELEVERRVAERRKQEPTVGEGVQTEPVGGTLQAPPDPNR
jgi:Spy/CpxP family protein refolding chaperone